MTDQISMLLASASQAQGAAIDMIEVVRDGGVRPIDNVGAGDTLVCLADGLKLLIEATDDTDDPDADINQLHGALIRFLETRT